MKFKLANIVIVFGFALSGCQQSTQIADTTATDTTPVAVNTGTSSGSGIDDGGAINRGPLTESVPAAPAYTGPTEAELLATTTLFFDFDRSELRADHRQILAAHARHLSENPGKKLRLEGHADERGSREYNIGLGQRRAQTVKRNLNLQGVQNSQLNTISYGEEKPLDPSHNEYAWQSNRRVELVYFN